MPTFISSENAANFVGVEDTGEQVFHFHDDTFSKLLGPGVYVAICGHGETLETLYVGSAKNILAGVSDPNHKSLREAMKRPTVRLMIGACSSEKRARRLELELIHDLQPTLNIVGVHG